MTDIWVIIKDNNRSFSIIVRDHPFHFRERSRKGKRKKYMDLKYTENTNNKIVVGVKTSMPRDLFTIDS